MKSYKYNYTEMDSKLLTMYNFSNVLRRDLHVCLIVVTACFLFLLPSYTFAQTRIGFNDAEAPVVEGKVYKIFCQRATLGVNDAGILTSYLNNNGNSNYSGEQYYFAFIADPANSDNIYLYSVKTKTFLCLGAKGSNNKYTTSFSSEPASRVYIFKTGDNTYPYTFAGSDNYQTAVFNTSGTDLSVSFIDEWHKMDGGNKFKLEEVNSVTLSDDDLSKARGLLSYTSKSTLEGKNISTSKVYTIKSKGGYYLTSNASNDNLAGSNAAATTSYEQFAFVTSSTDASKVYLYNISKKKFVSTAGTLQRGPAVRPINVFGTNDNDYPIALSFSDTWTNAAQNTGDNRGTNNIRLNNQTYSVSSYSLFDNTDRFQLAEVAGAVFSSEEIADARKYLSPLPTTFPLISARRAGLDVNKTVYTLKPIFKNNNDYRGGLYANDKGLTSTWVINRQNSNPDVDDHQKFVFVTKSDDTSAGDTLSYLYNVAEEKFVSGETASGSNSASNTSQWVTLKSLNPRAVYLTLTNDYDYNLALSFDPSVQWSLTDGNRSGAKFCLGVNHASGVFVNDYHKIDDEGSRFHAANVGTFSEGELAAARSFLSGYSTSTFASESLKTDNTVYTLESEAGGLLYANGSTLTSSTPATSADANTQFLFFTDSASTGAEKKVYLYSLGQKTFITPAMGYGSKSTAGAVTVYNTMDSHGYRLAFKLSNGTAANDNTWLNGAGLSNATDPDKSNRFQAVAVEHPDNSFSYAEAKTIFNGVYTRSTLEALGIDPTKVYYLTSDEFTTTINGTSQSGHVVAAGSGSSLNWYTQAKGTEYTSTTAPANSYFAFVTDAADPTIYYLYNVSTQSAANSSGNLVRGPSKQRVYVYATGNSQYPLAIGFSDTWDASGAKNLDASRNNTNGKLTSSSTTPANSKRWKLTEVANPTGTGYDLALAREVLNSEGNRVRLWQTGLTSKSVFSIESKRHVWYAGSDRLYAAPQGTKVDSSMKDYLFSFFTDSITGEMYLYSVGRKKIVSKASESALLDGGRSDSLFIYRTGDNTHPYMLAFTNSLPTTGSSNTNRNNGYYVINDQGEANTTGTFRIFDYSVLDAGNQVRFVQFSDVSYDQVLAYAALNGWLTNKFHYTGVHKRPLKRGMQDVAEVHYYYYVDENRNVSTSITHAVNLELPFYDYLGANGNNMEPHGYFRWYDYTTDSMPRNGRLHKFNTSANILKEQLDSLGRSLGYIGYDLNDHLGNFRGPVDDNVGAYYSIPTGADYDNWKGDVIACDVSRYFDYNDASGPAIALFTHEPTLSTRFIFHILPARKIADEMMDSLNNSGRTMGNKGLFVFGARNEDATMNIRVDLQHIGDYYFHPLSADALRNKHVYHPLNDTAHGFGNGNENGNAPGDFQPDLKQATGVEWRVYNAEMNAYRVITSGSGRNINIKINQSSDGNYGLRGSGWTDLSGNSLDNSRGTALNNSIKKGSTCYLVAYATNGNDKCPFFNARLDITETYPKSLTQITQQANVQRTEEYLGVNYGSTVATFSFDNDNTLQTTTPVDTDGVEDNLSPLPSDFAQRQYGFVYSALKDYNPSNTMTQYTHWFTPLHGDYCLYKRYQAIPADKTSEKTNGAQVGYFFYTDASDEARVMGYQDFRGSLCSGSQIVVSAWVANNAGGSSSAQPELRFELYGVEKDRDGNDLSTKLLANVCSGNFKNNIDDYVVNPNDNSHMYNIGTWYQVFAVFTLPEEFNVSQYRWYRISIDNFCNSTSGADYAIDDIQVYQRNAKITVTQKPALCADGDVSKIDLKVKAVYSAIRDEADANTEDKVVYYRFCREDGSPVTGTDFYGTGHNNWGEATIPHVVSDDTTKFEKDESGTQELILANKPFKLDADSTYYVSLTTDNPDSATAEWGRPSNICTFYSGNFNYVRQRAIIPSSQSTSVQLTAKCGLNAATDYDPVTFTLLAPDQVAGGVTMLPGIKFDYYLGTEAAMNSVTDAGKTTSLDEALHHYRTNYPGTSEFIPTPKTTSDVVYSAADAALLEANRYADDDAHRNGKLFLSASPSLSGFPIPSGRQTVLAMPAQDTVSVTINGKKYLYVLCNEPTPITVNVTFDGPGLVLGSNSVSYPSNEPYRSVRIGLPQIRKMGADGILYVPVARKTYGNDNTTNVPQEVLTFKNDLDSEHPTYLYIVNTNDSTIDLSDIRNNKFAELAKGQVAATDTAIGIKNIEISKLHEGYWYEFAVYFKRTDIASQCDGETYLTLKIVPEYLTWNPTADNGMNSNWNNDANWTRSTAAELYDPSYKDYRQATMEFNLYDAQGNVVKANVKNSNVDTSEKLLRSIQPASYVPMYFSKVTVKPLGEHPYPLLGYIQHNALTNIATRMTNAGNYSPTQNIEYDLEAAPLTVSDDANYRCVEFDGNVCEQIHFKTGAQLHNEHYLRYERAWVEMMLPVNMWGTFTTPMAHTFAGDMYLPKTNAVQATPLFREIRFDDVDRVNDKGMPDANGTYGLYGKAGDKLYNRMRMPTYQKLWGKGGTEYKDNGSDYPTHDNPTAMLIYPSAENGDKYWDSGTSVDSMNFRNGADNYDRHSAWSHTFNAVGSVSADKLTSYGYYRAGDGVAGKIGDDYATDKDWEAKHANYGSGSNRLAMANMRLPKADTEFRYYKADGNGGMTESELQQPIDRTDNYRLAIPYDPVDGALGALVIDKTRLTIDVNNNLPEDNQLYYVLIGNPYTSTISAKSFFDGNREVLGTVERKGTDGKTGDVYRYWSLVGNVLMEYDPSLNNSYISPGQSFFVKLKNKPGTDSLVFTNQMQVDPTIRTSMAMAAAAAAKRYTINDETDVRNVVEHGEDTHVYVWSPNAGTLAVSGSKIRRVEIFNLSGMLVASGEMHGSQKLFSVGAGIYIVRATLDDGKTESKKVAVK